jgi:hypothetical protein
MKLCHSQISLSNFSIGILTVFEELSNLAICRIPFVSVQQLESVSKAAFAVTTSTLSKMKANSIDAPYVFEKGSGDHLIVQIERTSTWLYSFVQAFCKPFKRSNAN